MHLRSSQANFVLSTGKITSKQLWSYPDGNPIDGNGEGNNDNEIDDAPSPAAPTSSSSSTPLAPSSSSSSSSQAWSDSSSWVASSSSSSSEPQKPAFVPTNTKIAQVAAPSPTEQAGTPAQDDDDQSCDASDDDAEDCDDSNSSDASSSDPASTASVPPVLIVQQSQTSSSATATSSQAGDLAAPVETPEASENVPAATSETAAEPAATPAPAPEAAPAPASGGASDGEVCDSNPGAWRCAGRSLQQCVQNRKFPFRRYREEVRLMPANTAGPWTWMTRVECKVDIINCDSPNPVCASY